MKIYGASLDEESLNTLFVEVEGIVNSRPLVADTINYVNSQAALSTSHIITMNSKVVMSPTGVSGRPDLYRISEMNFGVIAERNFLLLFKTRRNGKY